MCACVGDWIRQRFEAPGCFSMNNEQKRTLLAQLVRSTRYRKGNRRRGTGKGRRVLEGRGGGVQERGGGYRKGRRVMVVVTIELA